MDKRFRSVNPNPRSYQDFQPSSELVQDQGSDIFVINLPGFSKEQIKAQIDAYGTLKVSGERSIGGNKWTRFQKDCPVPANCNINEIRAEFDNGILQIIMPKLITEVDYQDQPSQNPITESKLTPTQQAPPSKQPATEPKPTPTQQAPPSQEPNTEPKPTSTPQGPQSQKPETTPDPLNQKPAAEPEPTPTPKDPPSQKPKSTQKPQAPPSQKSKTAPARKPPPSQKLSTEPKSTPTTQTPTSQKPSTEPKSQPTPQTPLSQEPTTEPKPTPIPQAPPSQKQESEPKSDKPDQDDTNKKVTPIDSTIRSNYTPKTLEEKKIWSTGSAEGAEITNEMSEKHGKNKGRIDGAKIKEESTETVINGGGRRVEDYIMEFKESKHLVVNMAVALLVIVVLVGHVTYTISSTWQS